MHTAPTTKGPVTSEMPPCYGTEDEKAEKARQDAVRPEDAPQDSESLKMPLHTRGSNRWRIGGIGRISHGRGSRLRGYLRSTMRAEPPPAFNCVPTSLTNHAKPPEAQSHLLAIHFCLLRTQRAAGSMRYHDTVPSQIYDTRISPQLR
jgi:hypothetical protein